MVKKDGATASIEENAEVQAPTEEQSNVQSSTAESVETQAPNEEDAEMQALFGGLDGNEPEQSGAEETAPKGKPTRADVLREARRRRAERSESVRAYQEFLIGLSSLTVAAKNHSIVYVEDLKVSNMSASASGTKESPGKNVKQRNDVDSEVPCVMIIALVEGRYKVSIPFNEFYQKNPIDMATVNMETKAGREEYVNRCATMAAKLYSLNVPMVITTIQVDESTDAEAGVPAYVIVASRKAALDIIEETNYGDRPDGDGPRIQEGDFVRAQITSVARDSIAVVVGGVDTRVPLHALTFEYLVDARTKYKVGQEIMVQVEQIIKEKDGHHIVEVNCKQPELERAKQMRSALPIGSIVFGIVSSVAASKKQPGNINVLAYIKMYDLPVLVNNMPAKFLGSEPPRGSTVRLKVLNYLDNGMILCRCIGTQGPMNFPNA